MTVATDSIETLILTGLMKDAGYLTKVVAYLDEDVFEGGAQKKIFSAIKKHYTEFSVVPEYASLHFDVLEDRELTNEQIKEIKTVLSTIDGLELPSRKWLDAKTEKFVKDRRIYLALVECVDIHDGTNKKKAIDAIPSILQDAISISFDSKVGMSFLKDAESRYDYYTRPENKIACGIKAIDDRTGGGMPTKTLQSFMGATGVGKTLSLCSLAVSYSNQGHNVLYISAEMKKEEILKRVDANKLDINLADFERIDRDKYLNAISRIKEMHQGDIVVEEFPPNTCTVNHIKKVLHDLYIRDRFKPKVLIVDYLGIMASAVYKKGAVQLHQYLKSISEELRGICVEHDMVGWTALQTNRSGVDSTDLGLDKVATSFDVTHGLDYLMSIWRTPEGDENSVIYMKEEKSRYSNRIECPVLTVGVDLYKQRLFDITKDSIKNLKRSRSIEAHSADTKDKLQAKFGEKRHKFLN